METLIYLRDFEAAFQAIAWLANQYWQVSPPLPASPLPTPAVLLGLSLVPCLTREVHMQDGQYEWAAALLKQISPSRFSQAMEIKDRARASFSRIVG